MRKNFWVITTHFNFAKFQALLDNYFIFANRLKAQNINLLTVELAFGDDSYEIPESENVVRLRSKSVMWQKERMINYGVSVLPSSCDNFAWVDGDIMFLQSDWIDMATKELKYNHIVQLFKRVKYMPKGIKDLSGRINPTTTLQGVIWQYRTHKNWLARRKTGELSFSSPGFAWAAQRSFFENLPGNIYDRNIIGSGDTFLVDCYLDSFDIHGYANKFNPYMKNDMMDYNRRLNILCPKVSYIPTDIYHLYHGQLRNRKYMERHDIILNHGYDPRTDIKLINNVYEWSSNKVGMHNDIKQYFLDRKEDE